VRGDVPEGFFEYSIGRCQYTRFRG
jgi:hypothetical protein